MNTKVIGRLEWCADVPDQLFTLKEAKSYARSFKSRWRVPTIVELMPLLDLTKQNPACSAFPNSPCASFWTVSPYLGMPQYARYVDFRGYGTHGAALVTTPMRVRLVRYAT